MSHPETNDQSIDSLLAELRVSARNNLDKMTTITERDLWRIQARLSLLRMEINQLEDDLSKLAVERYNERTELFGQNGSREDNTGSNQAIGK
ncbi:hypothetical protein PP744_gp097 [Rhizobium phage RHph_N38]|uniref:Uncharacterized protein n=1 Tax=Rhizobium phage RHph_N38 TaxID=2509750 RepID=A0A7S5R3L8_9CAUD|nr:hypothetical protein PP744_gp097 [Rhizobium phage RHph_N38]QIG70558.1 hypothetical protein EVB89_097 [Rhizobium phage RHph_N38]